MPTRKHRRRRYAAPVGGLFLLFALIGLVAVAFFSIRLTQRALDNTPEKNRIKSIITPVTMWDPVPFESPADIDPTQMLYYCMWSALLSEDRSYELDDNHELLVPASDLDVAATALFGSGIELQHATFGDYEMMYYYDEAREAYNVPSYANLYQYTPEVVDVEKVDDLYHVRVGYMAPSGAYTVNFSGNVNEPEPEKYMLYVLRQTSSGYQIVAVRDDNLSVGHGAVTEETPQE